jgi:hypothetical protein
MLQVGATGIEEEEQEGEEIKKKRNILLHCLTQS